MVSEGTQGIYKFNVSYSGNAVTGVTRVAGTFNTGLGSSVPRRIVYNATTSSLYLTTDRGVFRSTDGATTWEPMNAGLTDLSTDALAVSPDGSHVFVGASGGIWEYDSSTTQNSVPTITRVFNAAGYQAGVFPGSFISIQGTNLTPVADDWSHSIVDGRLPTQLDGVTVTVGGKPAYIYQMVPTQINVQAPDVGSGSMQVVVTTPAGSSPPFSVNSQLYGPAFWPWPNNQPVATHSDFTIAAKTGTFSGVPTLPAKPDEIVTLWGTGFGPTDPPIPAGQLPGNSAGASTHNAVTATLNGAPVTVLGAALSSYPGDYQVAIQVPTLPDGDYPFAASVNGVSSPIVMLTVQH